MLIKFAKIRGNDNSKISGGPIKGLHCLFFLQLVETTATNESFGSTFKIQILLSYAVFQSDYPCAKRMGFSN